MLSSIFVLLLCPTLVLLIQCNLCPYPISVDYEITENNFPSLVNCSLVDAHECSVTINWYRDNLGSMIVYTTDPDYEPDKVPNEILQLNTQFEMNGDEYLRKFSLQLTYKCQTKDDCNSYIYLKRILNSLTLSEKFSSEFSSILIDVQPFQNQCFHYMNSTEDCPVVDIDHCQRCLIEENSNKICATCPKHTSYFNLIKHEVYFVINNRSKIFDHIQLWCQKDQCNSIENIDKARQLSLIDFDFDKYFQSSSATINQSISIIFTLFIFLFMSLF